MRWVWHIPIFLGAAAVGFGVVADRPAVILVGALVLIAGGIARDYVGPDRRAAHDRRPVVWPRLLLALAALAVLGAILGALDTPAWLVLVLFVALGIGACSRPVDEWIHGGGPT